MKRRIAACVIALAMGATPALAQEEPDVLIAPAPACVASEFETGFRLGSEEARLRREPLWIAGGFFGGVSGPLGCVGVTGAAYALTPNTPRVGPAAAEDFKRGYRLGYRKEVRDRRTKNAFFGGTAGFLVLMGGYGFLAAREQYREDLRNQRTPSGFGARF